MAFAKIQIIGNVGRDPELRYTPSGKATCSFTVAVSHSKKNQQTGEWEDEHTDWYAVTVWGERGEGLAEKLHKGSKVFVSGRFKSREYETRDGRKGMSLDVTGEDVIELGAKAAAEASSRSSAPSGPMAGDAGDDVDELPF